MGESFRPWSRPAGEVDGGEQDRRALAAPPATGWPATSDVMCESGSRRVARGRSLARSARPEPTARDTSTRFGGRASPAWWRRSRPCRAAARRPPRCTGSSSAAPARAVLTVPAPGLGQSPETAARTRAVDVDRIRGGQRVGVEHVLCACSRASCRSSSATISAMAVGGASATSTSSRIRPRSPSRMVLAQSRSERRFAWLSFPPHAIQPTCDPARPARRARLRSAGCGIRLEHERRRLRVPARRADRRGRLGHVEFQIAGHTTTSAAGQPDSWKSTGAAERAGHPTRTSSTRRGASSTSASSTRTS